MIIINVCFWYVLGNQNGALKRLIFSWCFFGSTFASGTRQYVSDISHSFAKFSFRQCHQSPRDAWLEDMAGGDTSCGCGTKLCELRDCIPIHIEVHSVNSSPSEGRVHRVCKWFLVGWYLVMDGNPERSTSGLLQVFCNFPSVLSRWNQSVSNWSIFGREFGNFTG